ncbi:MAG: ABC transporter permease subunit [Thermoplasmata archaeon]
MTLGGLASLAVIPLLLGLDSSNLSAISSHFATAGVDLGASFLRMLLAYGASLAFSIVYGYFAAVHRTGERILIPVLDILQSIPILGFFPIAIVFFVGLTPHSWVGPNVASIFLIFTSMSWNMAFGVYESLKSVPVDLKEAAASFGVRGSQRLRQLLLPATINRLVYNSVLSWTAGWYFLVAAEIISTGSSSTTLPGIGSYLLAQAANGNTNALVAGIVLLVALIAVLDFVLWRPLGRWAEKYRYDQTPSGLGDVGVSLSGRTPLRRAAHRVVRGVRSGVILVGTPITSLAALATAPIRARSSSPRTRAGAFYVAVGSALIIIWLILIRLSVLAYGILTGPIDPGIAGDIRLLPLAVVNSFGRILVAYTLSLAIALPLAAVLARRPRVARVGLPVVEIVASVPATALFPLFIFALAGVPFIGFQGAAILMLVTGMVWYLFFNLLSGLRAIPPDLEEAAQSFCLPRRQYYRRVMLPAVIPALITGSITAFGGGWNALVLAEYLKYGTHQLSVLGVGELIDKGNFATGSSGLPLMVSALLTLVIVVVAVNELIWKPLYRRAVERYRYD